MIFSNLLSICSKQIKRVVIIDSALRTELLTSNTLSEGFIQYKTCLANDLDSLFEVLK
jgi:hypothetical protein